MQEQRSSPLEQETYGRVQARDRERMEEDEKRDGVEHGAVIIYRSRYHRLLVNRPHQEDGAFGLESRSIGR